MKRWTIKAGVVTMIGALCIVLLVGCQKTQQPQASGEHEPLTIMATSLDYAAFEQVIEEKFPEINLEFISYTGSNGTGYSEYLLAHGEIPDIYTLGVFGLPDQQRQYLLDLSGYEFLNNYKTADINQVTLDGAVYLLPTNATILGLYYNKTLFAERGWTVPENFEELQALAQTIRAAGIDPLAAQFELSGNGFFDLFTLAKTDFLSTSAGRQWEQDFQAGQATAAEGLTDAAAALQAWIDCGLLEADDTGRDSAETSARFTNREAAMLLNAGVLPSFTQNQDGTGDEYGLMPYYSPGEDHSVLITLPAFYIGLSNTLEKPGSEQKLEDALKIIAFLSTREGQNALVENQRKYITPLKNDVIPEESPFHEVEPIIRSGHTSNLAYAGYEPIIIDVGNKVRDWVAGECSGADVLALMDELQTDYLNGGLEPLAVAAQDFTLEETAQLVAESFRQAAGTDVGLVSLGGYHDGVQNRSAVCGKLFAGDITQEIVNAVVPALFRDPICILTLTGEELKALLESGFCCASDAAAFPYVPAGLTVTKNKDGTVKEILLADGSPLEEAASYTVAMDAGGFTDAVGEMGSAEDTGLLVAEVVSAYFYTHSPIAPLSL